MRVTEPRNCLHCKRRFDPDYRLRRDQFYCAKTACKKVRQAASLQRWREHPENQDYWRGRWNIARVQEWRTAHPEYWKRVKRKPVAGGGVALQNAMKAAQATTDKRDKDDERSDCVTKRVPADLRTQDPVLVGLIAQLTGDTLQNAIHQTTARLTPSPLQQSLDYLRLDHVAEHYETLAREAAEKGWSLVDYLQRLLEGEYCARQARARARRVRSARFPVVKTLADFRWDWPKKIDEMKVKHLFRLDFVEKKGNVIFCGTVGTGKTHLASALGHEACQRGYSVLFTTAVDALNNLHAAAATHRLPAEFKRYLSPQILYIDELGYLPMDKAGADLLFQLISQRYERGSIILTTNRAYKQWPEIFNNDAMIASALLDRLLHNAETVVITGKSYRMKDQIEPPL